MNIRAFGSLATAALINGSRFRYWHRMHQLPGITCRAFHKVNLRLHSWPSKSTDRQRLVALHGVTTSDGSIPSHATQIWFSRISRDLLEARFFPLSILRWHSAYMTAVEQRGYANVNGRIRFEDLRRRFDITREIL